MRKKKYEKHWIKPELQEQPELMQVKLTLHIQNKPVNEPVNERQQTILSIMKQNPSIIREDLANKLGISLATLKRELTSLRKVTLHVAEVIKMGNGLLFQNNCILSQMLIRSFSTIFGRSS